MDAPDTDRRALRLLHASDCHLGASPRPTANEAAFVALVDLAMGEDVDAVLVSGDLFDTPRVHGEMLDWTIDQLHRLACPVVVLPGNHDWFEDQSPFRTIDFEQRCSHVHVLDERGGELLELSELGATFYGRAVHDHEPWFRPLADLPPRPVSGWGVLMGHGLVVDSDHPSTRGSPIYPRDLACIDWDYVALGHWSRYWHVQSEPVPVVYAGNTACSQGERPGCVMVELSPDRGVTPTWTPLG